MTLPCTVQILQFCLTNNKLVDPNSSLIVLLASSVCHHSSSCWSFENSAVSCIVWDSKAPNFSSIKRVLHYFSIVGLMKEKPIEQSHCFPFILHLFQNLVPNLPTMQPTCWNFDQRFKCVLLVEANVAWSHKNPKQTWGVGYWGLGSSLLSNSTPPNFSISCIFTLVAKPQLTLTHTTLLE